MTDLDVANAMADAAREITQRMFRAHDLETENKDAAGFDPVTQADRDAETAMRDVLERLRPEDGILGEEHGEKTGTSGRRWVLDPIDGTRAFISGLPTWGTLIGLEEEGGKTLLGMVDQPHIDERYTGFAGEASLTYKQSKKSVRVRDTHRLEDAILFTTFPEIGTNAERRAFEAVSKRAHLTRYGTDCYAYALLGAGQIDLVIEAGLQSYDILGPLGVIENAGGIVTTWEGDSAAGGGRVVAACSKELHATVLEILNNSG